MSTRWTPDTCNGCSFDITHDANGKQVLLAVVSKCKDHQKHDDFNSHKNALGENQMRMKVISEMAKADPTLMKKDLEGNDVIDMSKIDHSFDKDRKLSVFCKGKTIEISLGEDVASTVQAVTMVDKLNVD